MTAVDRFRSAKIAYKVAVADLRVANDMADHRPPVEQQREPDPQYLRDASRRYLTAAANLDRFAEVIRNAEAIIVAADRSLRSGGNGIADLNGLRDALEEATR